MQAIENFEAIVQEHYELLFRFALSLTRSEPDAKDLTQHAFYVLATKGHQLRDPTKVKTWLFTTLHRAFIHLRRRQERFVGQELDASEESLSADSLAGTPALDATPVLAALARLDAVYRAPVALFYLEDYSYQEIARILDVPLGTIKSRLSRGLAQLRKSLIAVADPAEAPASDKTAPAIQDEGKVPAMESACPL